MSAITKRAWRQHRKAARKALLSALRLTETIKKDCVDIEQRTRQTAGKHKQCNEMADKLTSATQAVVSCRRLVWSALSEVKKIPPEPPQAKKNRQSS